MFYFLKEQINTVDFDETNTKYHLNTFNEDLEKQTEIEKIIGAFQSELRFRNFFETKENKDIFMKFKTELMLKGVEYILTIAKINHNFLWYLVDDPSYNPWEQSLKFKNMQSPVVCHLKNKNFTDFYLKKFGQIINKKDPINIVVTSAVFVHFFSYLYYKDTELFLSLTKTFFKNKTNSQINKIIQDLNGIRLRGIDFYETQKSIYDFENGNITAIRNGLSKKQWIKFFTNYKIHISHASEILNYKNNKNCQVAHSLTFRDFYDEHNFDYDCGDYKKWMLSIIEKYDYVKNLILKNKDTISLISEQEWKKIFYINKSEKWTINDIIFLLNELNIETNFKTKDLTIVEEKYRWHDKLSLSEKDFLKFLEDSKKNGEFDLFINTINDTKFINSFVNSSYYYIDYKKVFNNIKIIIPFIKNKNRVYKNFPDLLLFENKIDKLYSL